MNKCLVINRVKNMVCEAVNSSFAVIRPDINADVAPDAIFGSTYNMAIIAARYFTFRTLHDIYGFSYRELSVLSGIKLRRIMRAVKIVRENIFFDPLYMTIKKEIDNKVTKGII